MAARSTQASQRPGLEAREHNPVLSLDRYSVWTACAPGRGQLSNSAQPEVTASGVPRYGAGSAGQSRSLAFFFELSCLFQLLSHREMLLEMGQSARRRLLQVGVVPIFGRGFK